MKKEHLHFKENTTLFIFFILLLFFSFFLLILNDHNTITGLTVSSLEHQNYSFDLNSTAEENNSFNNTINFTEFIKNITNINKSNNKNSSLKLNLSSDKIKEIRGSSLKNIVVRLERNSQNELWIYDIENDNLEKIGYEESALSSYSSIGLKDNFVFWLTPDSKFIFYFDILNKQKVKLPVPPYDITKGERAAISFPNFSWTVLIDKNHFYFYKLDTGEVFSDEDQIFRELFRKKQDLDLFLTNEELSFLDLEIKNEVEYYEN